VYDSSSWPTIGGITAIWTIGAELRGAERGSGGNVGRTPVGRGTRGFVGLYLDSCYKTDMTLKNKTLALILVCLFLGSAAGACSSFVGQKSKPNVETAADGGEEEVLDPDGHDDEELASSDDENGETSTGSGILISVTYLVMTLGAAALPFLVLL